MIFRLITILFLCGLVSPVLSQDTKPDVAKPKEVITYKDHVAPILRKHCGNCHNPDKATSDFDVTTYQKLMAGGSSGEAISAGSPDSSRLYKSVAHIDEPFMSPKAAKISTRWVGLPTPT